MAPDQVEAYLRTLVGKSAPTIAMYRSVLTRFVKYCGKREPSVEVLSKFLYYEERFGKKGANTIRYYATICKLLLRWMRVDLEELQRVSVPAYVKPYREHIEPEDWETFLNTIPDLDDFVVFDTLLHTGMRVGALLTLRPEDIRPRERRLYAYGSQPIPLTERVLEGLQGYMRRHSVEPGGMIFFGYNEKLIGERLRLHAKNANIKGWKKLTPHSTRHSFAIFFIQRSKRPSALEDLRRFLGHARLTTTQVYLDYGFKESQDAYDEVFSTKGQASKE
jgi:integrase